MSKGITFRAELFWIGKQNYIKIPVQEFKALSSEDGLRDLVWEISNFNRRTGEVTIVPTTRPKRAKSLRFN